MTLMTMLFVALPAFMLAQTQETTYKDPYGHTTGTSTSKKTYSGNTETIYKDRYGHTTGSSTTRKR